MGHILTGDQHKTASRRIGELMRQLGQAEFPYDPERFLEDLQSLVERGRLIVAMIVEVVYGLAFDAMVRAGRYGYVNPDFTSEHFPAQGIGTARFEAILVHLGRDVSTEAAKAEIERQGLIPASAAELLAFGAKYPEEQRKYPIVALGQSWLNPDGCSYFPCLWDGGRGRSLRLRRGADDWDVFFRFLALRKIS